MTTWYVTTGISLWESSRCWKLKEEDSISIATDQCTEKELSAATSGPRLMQQWAKVREDIKSLISRANPAAKDRQAEELVRIYFRQECWAKDRLRALPAELATLCALFQKAMIQTGDTIAFIAGESNKDVAHMLKAMLAVALEGAPPVTINIVGPFKLDPTDDAAFKGGIADMWKQITAGAKAFVLTGGYKAVLIAIARYVSDGTDVYYSHENNPGAVIQVKLHDGQVTITYIPS